MQAKHELHFESLLSCGNFKQPETPTEGSRLLEVQTPGILHSVERANPRFLQFTSYYPLSRKCETNYNEPTTETQQCCSQKALRNQDWNLYDIVVISIKKQNSGQL